MKKKNQGFTLIEMVIAVSILAILLGMLSMSLNPVIGFRVQRASGSIQAAIAKTRIEAMSRLVGEMKLERKADGFYISYYLDRGKNSGVKEEQPEKISPAGVKISYMTDAGEEVDLNTPGDFLILTFDRETGGFREIQTGVLDQTEIDAFLNSNQNISFKDSGKRCSAILIRGGSHTKRITLCQATGEVDVEEL